MRTIELNLFKFEELSKEAQDVAKRNVEEFVTLVKEAIDE